MKKIAILATVVATTILVSCGSSTCTCSNPDNDSTVKIAIDAHNAAKALSSAYDTEANCTLMNTQVKAVKSTASCTWG